MVKLPLLRIPLQVNDIGFRDVGFTLTFMDRFGLRTGSLKIFIDRNYYNLQKLNTCSLDSKEGT